MRSSPSGVAARNWEKIALKIANERVRPHPKSSVRYDQSGTLQMIPAIGNFGGGERSLAEITLTTCNLSSRLNMVSLMSKIDLICKSIRYDSECKCFGTNCYCAAVSDSKPDMDRTRSDACLATCAT